VGIRGGNGFLGTSGHRQKMDPSVMNLQQRLILELSVGLSFGQRQAQWRTDRTRTRTNTNPNGTEANAAGRSGNARALRKQSKCGMIQEGEGHWPNSSENLQKARNLWVLRTPQNNKEEGARAKKLVTCGTRGPLGRGQSVPFSAQGAYCSAPEPSKALTGQELLPRSRSGSE